MQIKTVRQKKIRLYPKKLYKVKLKVIIGAAPNEIEVKEYVFRFGKPTKDHYIDIFEKEGYEAAEDMKLVNRLHPPLAMYCERKPLSFFGHNDIKSRGFWKLHLLWGETSDNRSMEAISDDHNIRWNIEKKRGVTVIDVVYFQG